MLLRSYSNEYNKRNIYVKHKNYDKKFFCRKKHHSIPPSKKKQKKTLFMHTCVFVGTQNIKQRCRLLKCQNSTQITHSEYVYKQRLQRPQLRACATPHVKQSTHSASLTVKQMIAKRDNNSTVFRHIFPLFSSDVLFASADFRFNLPHLYASHNTLYNRFEWILQIYTFEIEKKNCF